MKIRNGFVSNSSSSSYICEICAHGTVDYDFPDGFTYACNTPKQHIFHEECFKKLFGEPEYDENHFLKNCPVCAGKFENTKAEEIRQILEEMGVID